MSRRYRTKDLNFGERCILEVLWVFCWGLSQLPHFVLYGVLSPSLYFIFYRLVGYRKRVVRENIAQSFPEKSSAEQRAICDKFYTVLSEVMISFVAQADPTSGRKIFPDMDERLDNSASPQRDQGKDAFDLRTITRDRSWIALTAHFGMWEYLTWWSTFANQRMLAVYHPLQNKIFEVLFQRFRGKSKVYPLPATESVRFVIKNGLRFRGESYLLGLIADQNPPLLPESNWFDFLGRETVFFEGGEKIARKMKLPVYFIYQKRIGRGQYTFHYKLIWDGVEQVEPTEITRRYVAMLEEEIRKTPYMWLWSHKRWKHKRDRTKIQGAESAQKAV
ncbi:MAG: lysophospholipid acyltransferase family protein [Rikenellaceae bacterium]